MLSKVIGQHCQPVLAVMTSGDGSTSSAGIFTDGTNLWIANGDGSVQQLYGGENDAWFTNCRSRASRGIATLASFERRASGFNINKVESKSNL